MNPDIDYIFEDPDYWPPRKAYGFSAFVAGYVSGSIVALAIAWIIWG